MTTKLTNEEIDVIKGFKEKTQNIILDLGKIELQLSDLESVKSQVIDIMRETSREQTEFFKQIEATYGKGQINLETYEYIATEPVDAVVSPISDAEIL